MPRPRGARPRRSRGTRAARTRPATPRASRSIGGSEGHEAVGIDDRPRNRSQILFLRHLRPFSQVVHTHMTRVERTSSSSLHTQARRAAASPVVGGGRRLLDCQVAEATNSIATVKARAERHCRSRPGRAGGASRRAPWRPPPAANWPFFLSLQDLSSITPETGGRLCFSLKEDRGGLTNPSFALSTLAYQRPRWDRPFQRRRPALSAS